MKDYYIVFFNPSEDEFYKIFFTSEDDISSHMFWSDVYEVASGYFDNLRDWRVSAVEEVE